MAVGHDQPPAAAPLQRSGPARKLLALFALLLIVLFAGLGTWQVYRLQWKLDLIARVDARVHAAPVAAPPAAQWGQVSKTSHEYRRVQLSGHYLYAFTTPVQAVSSLGAGFWLLTPLCTVDGHIVFINRGFVPAAPNMAGRYPARRAGADACAAGGPQVSVTGLLRLPEPATHPEAAAQALHEHEHQEGVDGRVHRATEDRVHVVARAPRQRQLHVQLRFDLRQIVFPILVDQMQLQLVRPFIRIPKHNADRNRTMRMR